MIRYVLLALAFFLATKIMGGLFKPASEHKTTVKGESKNDTLDLSDDDVIDVEFKEVKE